MLMFFFFLSILCRATTFRFLCLVPWNLVVVGFPTDREDRRSDWHLRDGMRRGVSRGPRPHIKSPPAFCSVGWRRILPHPHASWGVRVPFLSFYI
jgi:hypothetical protein